MRRGVCVLRGRRNTLEMSQCCPVVLSLQARVQSCGRRSSLWRAQRKLTLFHFWVDAKREIAFLDCGNEDAWLLGSMLLMIWGGLRWSDAQRLQLATLTIIDKSSLRARCWRTKTCPSGLTQRNWGSIFAQQLDQVRSRYPLRDFLLDRQGVPLSYASMLGQMRRCLCQYADLQPSQALGFSLHSCKATTIAWALQLDVPLAMRAAQGHHRLLNDCVAKYGRDDVWPQLQCQKRILLAVARAWQPARSLQRGLHTVAEEASVITALCPQTEQTDTESECEEAGQAAVDLLSEEEGADSDDGDACPLYRGCEPVGLWLVNTKTDWPHRAVSGSDAGVVSDGLRWGLACRPAAAWLAIHKAHEPVLLVGLRQYCDNFGVVCAKVGKCFAILGSFQLGAAGQPSADACGREPQWLGGLAFKRWSRTHCFGRAWTCPSVARTCHSVKTRGGQHFCEWLQKWPNLRKNLSFLKVAF